MKSVALLCASEFLCCHHLSRAGHEQTRKLESQAMRHKLAEPSSLWVVKPLAYHVIARRVPYMSPRQPYSEHSTNPLHPEAAATTTPRYLSQATTSVAPSYSNCVGSLVGIFKDGRFCLLLRRAQQCSMWFNRERACPAGDA